VNYNENELRKEIGLGIYSSEKSNIRPLSAKPVERSKTPIITNTPVLKKNNMLPEYEQYRPKINGIVPPYKP
jgi:hypothetical protein